MVCVLVRFALPAEADRRSTLQAFHSAVPRFQGLPGLARKFFLMDVDHGQAGSVYLWADRRQAVSFHDETWRAHIAAKYGAPPMIDIFDCPLEIDNLLDRVVEHRGELEAGQPAEPADPAS